MSLTQQQKYKQVWNMLKSLAFNSWAATFTLATNTFTNFHFIMMGPKKEKKRKKKKVPQDLGKKSSTYKPYISTS